MFISGFKFAHSSASIKRPEQNVLQPINLTLYMRIYALAVISNAVQL